MRNTITEDKLTNTFASRDNMTGDAPTARTGLGALLARWWVPASTPTVHQCLYGGRPWVARNHLHTTTPKRLDQGLQRHALVTNMVTNMVAEPVC